MQNHTDRHPHFDDHEHPEDEHSAHDELQRIPVIRDAAPTEPALIRVAKAMVALADALPGVCYATVGVRGGRSRPSLAVHCETDEAVRGLAETLGVEVTLAKVTDRCWLNADLLTGPIWISLTGPHHSRDTVDLDEAKVDAALAQAEAAL